VNIVLEISITLSVTSAIFSLRREPSVKPFSLLGTNRAPRTVVLKEDWSGLRA